MSELDPHYTTFSHLMGLTLDLDANGKKAKIFSGHIEGLSLSFETYGHTGGILFSNLSEEVDALLKSKEITKVTLTFKAYDPFTQMEEPGPPLLELKGIVTSCTSKPLPHVEGKERSSILYQIWFSDSAKTTMEEHFPIKKIYVDQSMKEVLENEKEGTVSIKYDWDKMEAKHPIIAFSLEQEASFYSFLFWFLHLENGILNYDYKADTYTITGKKSKPPGKPLDILEWWVEPPHCQPARPVRHNTKKIKQTAKNIVCENKESPKAFKKSWRGVQNSENHHRFPELYPETVQSSLEPEKDLLTVEFIEMGKLLIDQLLPGMGVTLKGNNGGTWSKAYKDKTFRIRSLSILSDKLTATEELEKPTVYYRSEIRVTLEEEDEPYVFKPAFVPPVYPFPIAGHIFSDIGDKEQTTYKTLEPEKAPLGQYVVNVPTDEGEKKVVAPFLPEIGFEHTPYKKNQDVELLVHFRTAVINRCIEWLDLVRAPAGTQVDQFVFASNGKDEYTTLRHEYKDGKNSIFTIKQSSSETQTQTVEIQKEEMALFVEEKDKKKLVVHIHKEKGLLVSLEDQAAGTTQQILLDGKNITHTCKGSAGTSTIIQGPESISFDCKKFIVNGEEIALTAKDKITANADSAITIQAKTVDIPAKKVNSGS